MKKKEDTGFAAKLKAVREAAGVTQQQLADKIGMNRFSVAKLEQGVTEPYWPTVQKLARALGVDCTAFADCEEVQPEPAPARGKNNSSNAGDRGAKVKAKRNGGK